MYNFFNSNQMPFQFFDISKMPCPFQIPLIPEGNNAQQGGFFPFQMPQMPFMDPGAMNANMMQMWSNMLPFFNMFPFSNMFQMPWMGTGAANSQNTQNQQNAKTGASGMPFQIPGLDLSRLLQMDLSPENLNKLQKILDFVFEAYTQEKETETAQ